MKVLVTSGGTKVPIDGVRFIGNSSSGNTGAIIASAFSKSGHDVTLLRATDATPAASSLIRETIYSEFEELRESLKKELRSSYDAIIHLAAVSDFLVDKIESKSGDVLSKESKLNSDEGLLLHLKTAPKLINELREYSANRNIVIVGFKLTNENDLSLANDTAQKASLSGFTNMTVHNHLPFIDKDRHPARFLISGKLIDETETKETLAEALLTKVEELHSDTLS